MKKLYILGFIIAAVLTAGKCGTTVIDKNGVVGGWNDQETTVEIVQKAYKFLQKEVSENFKDISLVKIISAQTQVVAGYNVMLKCEYKNKDKVADNLKAIIHIDPQDTYKLIHFGFEIPKMDNKEPGK